MTPTAQRKYVRAVTEATDLFALCDALNAAERETAEWRASPEFDPCLTPCALEEAFDLDFAGLPTWGPAPPDTSGVWSYDEEDRALLYDDHVWFVEWCPELWGRDVDEDAETVL